MTTLLRHHIWHLAPILYPFVSQITSEKMRYRPSWLIDIHHSLGWPIIPFHNKNGISILIHPVRNHLASETRAVFQTNGTHLISSSRIRYPKKTQKKSVRSPHQDERHPNDQWKSDKLLTLLDGRTRFLSFDFRYENDMRHWMFEQRRVWRIAIFSLDLFIIRRTPRHAVSFTHFSSGLIPI